MTAEGHNQANTFGNASYWADYSTGTAAKAPYAVNNSNATGLEYIITNNYSARTVASSSNVFYGHVTVGTVDSPGTIVNKCYGATICYLGGLTVVNGQYTATRAGGSDFHLGPEGNAAQISGTIEVLSPNASPFLFGGNSGSVNSVLLEADIVGGEDAGVLLGSEDYTWTASKIIALSGDNSKYLGSIELGRGSYITNVIGSATALGGAPSALNDEAVKISTKGNGVLVFRSSVGSCTIPATRGVFFNGVAGGSLYPRYFGLDLEEGADVEILGPVKASGTCSNGRRELAIEKLGRGTLTLSGPVTLTDAEKFSFRVSEGRVVLGSATAMALTNELSEAVWLKSPSAAEYAVSGYALREGAGFVVRHEKGVAGTFVLDSTCTISATPIGIQLKTDERGYDAYEVCVLKVPTAVKTLTAVDFVDVDVSADYDYPKTSFRVEEEDGMQRVYLCRAANDTIAHLTFENGFTSRVRKGTLSAEPKVVQKGAVLTNEVRNVRLTEHGDRETTLRANEKALGVGGGMLTWSDPGDLLRYDSMTIEFYIKAGAQSRWQCVFDLQNGRADRQTVFSFLFDSALSGKVNTGLKVSHVLLSEDGSLCNSGHVIAPQNVGDDKWHHIAYTIKPNATDPGKTDLQYYVDYRLVASATADGRLCYEPAQGATFNVCADTRWASGNKFYGLLDEIRITRGVLGPDQFLQLRRERGGICVIIR